jgi:peptidoglycan hydrolase-like protein with peptidoglycan-binding domain
VAAIKAFQAAAGLPPDGYASARVLKALREPVALR